LWDAGFRVEEAATGAEALDRAASQPDLIVLAGKVRELLDADDVPVSG